MMTKNRKRGGTLIGLMGMVVFLGVMCALILERSVETARAGQMLEWRLQARAAAEGVAALAAADPAKPPAPQSLGAAVITCGQPSNAANAITMPLVVEIRSDPADNARFTEKYQAHFVREGPGWRLLRLE